jgi:hypothetical protein
MFMIQDFQHKLDRRIRSEDDLGESLIRGIVRCKIILRWTFDVSDADTWKKEYVDFLVTVSGLILAVLSVFSRCR